MMLGRMMCRRRTVRTGGRRRRCARCVRATLLTIQVCDAALVMDMAHQHHLRRRRLVTAMAISRGARHDWAVRPRLPVPKVLREAKRIVAVLDAAMPVIDHCLARGSSPPDPWALCNYAQAFADRLREMSGDRVPWVTELMCRRADLLEGAAGRLWLAMVQRD